MALQLCLSWRLLLRGVTCSSFFKMSTLYIASQDLNINTLIRLFIEPFLRRWENLPNPR